MILSCDYDENKIHAGIALDAHTKLKLGEMFNFKDLNVSFIYKDGNTICGRIVGSIFFNCLHIEMLVVEPDQKGKGVGSQLLNAAEKIAIDNKCHYIHLSSMSFNAPNFYIKHGYQTVLKVNDSPLPNEDHYYFIKYIR